MAVDPAPGRGALAVLCLCAFTHSYLLFSVFPYGAYYALHLLGEAGRSGGWVTVDTVGVYAGEFTSALSIRRPSVLVDRSTSFRTCAREKFGIGIVRISFACAQACSAAPSPWDAPSASARGGPSGAGGGSGPR